MALTETFGTHEQITVLEFLHVNCCCCCCCYFKTNFMLFLNYFHAIFILFSFYFYTICTLFLFYFHAFCIYCCHTIFTLFSCYFYTVFILFLCYFHAIFILFSRGGMNVFPQSFASLQFTKWRLAKGHAVNFGNFQLLFLEY